jgi:hypothetical protein
MFGKEFSWVWNDLLCLNGNWGLSAAIESTLCFAFLCLTFVNNLSLSCNLKRGGVLSSYWEDMKDLMVVCEFLKGVKGLKLIRLIERLWNDQRKEFRLRDFWRSDVKDWGSLWKGVFTNNFWRRRKSKVRWHDMSYFFFQFLHFVGEADMRGWWKWSKEMIGQLLPEIWDPPVFCDHDFLMDLCLFVTQ